MAGKFSFQFRSTDRRRELPHKIVIGQRETETVAHVLLKLFGYVLFYDSHLQIEPRLDHDVIPYQPDLLRVDYELRPVLWVECGECGLEKLDRLAVKVPEAAIWVMKRSASAAEQLVQRMTRAGLRRDRYQVIGLDQAMFDEVEGLVQSRNAVVWVAGEFDPPNLQFDFNGLWFDAPFSHWRL